MTLREANNLKSLKRNYFQTQFNGFKNNNAS